MAKTESVWSIDIGNSSLKALRCRLDDRPDRIVATAFDFIEYPKILTQPGAEPAELVGDALRQFQSRNGVRGDRVAVSVSGQGGLTRFIRLPPVEAKRIPAIVNYEAKQQIPFPLPDVVWRYQRMGGGLEEEGFVLDAEVGLFAMKRDQVYRALEPFRKAGIEIDFIQLAPLALYNYFVYDQLPDLPPADEYDPTDPPASHAILSMGTDATDLVITNGYRVWQRSIPLGGNHFTRTLTKELKLTFAKAEHLKRNAASAEDPKAVFQAMRPVFNDLLTEVQRSITYFTSINRTAKISKLVTLGNATKLPGLQRYLSQSLGYELTATDSFRGLAGPEVVEAPAFKENRLSFGTCYGLALQALGKGSLKTNLLPEEIVRDRLVREKKPWAVAAAAVLLLALTISFVGFSRALGKMGESTFGDAENAAQEVISQSKRLEQEADTAKTAFDSVDQIGKNLLTTVEGRIQWLELLRAINSCLPTDPRDRDPPKPPEELTVEDITNREKLYITSLDCRYWPSLATWRAGVSEYYRPLSGEAEATESTEATEGAAADPAAPATEVGTGEATEDAGWVISLTGYHYHNPDRPGELSGARYVRERFVRKLQDPKTQVLLPKANEPLDASGAPKVEWVRLQDLGIDHPILISVGRIRPFPLVNPYVQVATRTGVEPGEGGTYGVRGGSAPMMSGGSAPMMSGDTTMGPTGRQMLTGQLPEGAVLELRRYDFVVQFIWQPATASQRQEEKAEAEPQAESPL